jgi:Na+-transporting methylmalonyl-CoA/oxaloacetate decarboxylase gamma subunit
LVGVDTETFECVVVLWLLFAEHVVYVIVRLMRGMGSVKRREFEEEAKLKKK